MKKNLVEPVYGDGVVLGDMANEDFESVLQFLDFPMESLEPDSLSGEFDPTGLGPIPLDTLFSPLFPQGNISSNFLDIPKSTIPSKVHGVPPKTQLMSCKGNTGKTIPHQKFGKAHESGGFQSQSPVSVLESGGSCSSGKFIPIKPNTVIPVRPRSKHARRPAYNPWLLEAPIFSSAADVLASKSSSAKSKRETKKKRLSQLSVNGEAVQESIKQVMKGPFGFAYAADEEVSPHQSVSIKKCTHCQVTKTPQWREGPMGPKTLCNACGVRYRTGRLFPEYRPAASPTFVPALHSNSHKKVIEMRKQVEHTVSAQDSDVENPFRE